MPENPIDEIAATNVQDPHQHTDGSIQPLKLQTDVKDPHQHTDGGVQDPHQHTDGL